MRKQYEMELQALRKEFSLHQKREMDPSPTRENKDHKQSDIHLINQSMYSQAQELTLNSER